jgi:BirA family transcriptional regulator, biotin operon repressor / biotin---[acetyl-CoA-carboxylase] ligase
MEYQDFHFDSLPSTQDWAKEHIDELTPQKILCVTADEQTKGKGRFQRKWVSPKGANISATFVIRLPLTTLHLISLAQLLALSFAKILLNHRLLPKIKWPNDVLVSGKKLSGVLCETSYQKNHVDVFLGIGINVNMEKETLDQIDQPATSLKNETGKTWERKKLLDELKKQFLKDLSLFLEQGFTPFHYELENLLAFKHEQIEVFDGKRVWKGMLHSLTTDGQMNLLLPDGTMQNLLAGEVSSKHRD